MQYIARSSFIYLFRVIFVLIMMFSLPAVEYGELYSTEQELNYSEVDRYERKFIDPARTASPITHDVGVARISAQERNSAASSIPILPALCLYFYPIIYKYLLRLLLYPLKFITHFVVVPAS